MSWKDMFNDPKDKSGIFANKDKEFLRQVKDIIEELKKAGMGHSQELEAFIILWLRSVLERFGGELGDRVNFSGLSQEVQATLMQEIEQLLQKLKAMGYGVDIDELKNLLLVGIFQSLSKVKEEMQEELDYEFMTEKDRKRLRDELIRIAIYELYKIVNPRRLAGETLMQNFMNNVIFRGVDFAMKHAGGSAQEVESYGFSKGFVRALEDMHHAVQRDPKLLEDYFKDMSHIDATLGPPSPTVGPSKGGGRGI